VISLDKKALAAIVLLAAAALLIVFLPQILLEIAVYGGAQSLTRGVTLQDAGAYWSNAEIAITNYTVMSNGKVFAAVKNNKPFAIRVESITLIGENETIQLGIGPTKPFPPNQTWGMDIPCPPGKASFSYRVIINYTDADYGTPYSFVGTLPLQGTCK